MRRNAKSKKLLKRENRFQLNSETKKQHLDNKLTLKTNILLSQGLLLMMNMLMLLKRIPKF
nr:hypothetical protein Iba_chr04dCG8720 [Ipomoea batatas]